MKGYRIKIIRHGKTLANSNSSYVGITDIPLCDEGVDEISDIACEYDYGYVDRIYSSPLKRCLQTAKIIFPEDEIYAINELGEMSFGDFENRSQKELADLPEYKEWLKGGIDNAPPNGESLRQVIERVFEGLSTIIYDMMDNDLHDALVVTHGGILMNILSCFGVPKIDPTEYVCGFGEGFEIYVSADMWQRSNAFEIKGLYPYNRVTT